MTIEQYTRFVDEGGPRRKAVLGAAGAGRARHKRESWDAPLYERQSATTTLEMEWPEDESTTSMWQPSHLSRLHAGRPDATEPVDLTHLARHLDEVRDATEVARPLAARRAKPTASTAARARPVTTNPSVPARGATRRAVSTRVPVASARPLAQPYQPAAALQLHTHAEPAAGTGASASPWLTTTFGVAALFVTVLSGRLLTAPLNAPAAEPRTAPAPELIAPERVTHEVTAAREPVHAATTTSFETAHDPPPTAAGTHDQQPTAAYQPPKSASHGRGMGHSRRTNTARSQRSAEPESGALAPNAPAIEAPARAVSMPAQTTSQFGVLRVNSRPWAEVFIDGKFIGNTPQPGLRLTAGHHTLTLVNEPLDMRKTIDVELAPGETLTKVINLIE